MSRDFIQERLAQLPKCGATLVTRSYTNDGVVLVAVETVMFGDGPWTRCYLYSEDRQVRGKFDPTLDEFIHYQGEANTNEAATAFYNDLMRRAS